MMDKVTCTNTVTGVVSIVAQEVWTLGAITFAPKDAKGHTTMQTVRLMEDTDLGQSDMDFIMW